MKASDYELVDKLMRVKTKLDESIKQVDYYTDNLSKAVHTKGHSSFTEELPKQGDLHGHSSYLSSQSDKSGWCVDMTGCYVEVDCVHAIKEVLIKKEVLVVQELIKLGVEF